MLRARSKTRWLSLGLVSSLLALTACPGKIPIDALQDKVSTALCKQMVLCHRYPDKDTCTATLMLDYTRLVDDVHAGRIAYDEEKAADCVDDIADGKGPGSCSLTDHLSPADASSCKAAVQGKVGLGEPCFESNECGSGLCDSSGCAGGAECCAGKCQQEVPINGDCAAPEAVCADGAFCEKDPGGLGLVCRAKAAPGAPCVGSSGCQAGNVCVVDPGTGKGTCGRLPGERQTCASADGSGCDAIGDYCDPTAGVCKPRVGVDGACPKHVECAVYAKCDVASGRCVARGSAGGSCTTDGDCLDPLTCLEGICRADETPALCPYPTPSP